MATIPKPLVVIVGETASGKSALAMEIARRFNGEIICADSRTIYKGLDIGTAKPTQKETRAIKHHLLDIVDPDENFSAAQFKELALKAIGQIQAEGKLPILVGGSGLYIDAVIYDYGFADANQAKKRDKNNPRHLAKSVKSTKKALQPSTLIIGLSIDREILKKRIEMRVNAMVNSGLVDEVQKLAIKFGWETPALQAPAYRAFRGYVEDKLSLDGAEALFVKYDLQLAKKQRTWFKRNKSIHWVKDQIEAVDLVTTLLNK